MCMPTKCICICREYRGVTGKSFQGGGEGKGEAKSLFPIYSRCDLQFFFLVEISILVEPEKSFSGLKGPRLLLPPAPFVIFSSFSSFPFPFFFIFSYIFHFLPFLLTTLQRVVTVGAKNFPAESLGSADSALPPPRLLPHCVNTAQQGAPKLEPDVQALCCTILPSVTYQAQSLGTVANTVTRL